MVQIIRGAKVTVEGLKKDDLGHLDIYWEAG
jgi:hypothetical protein